MIFTKIPIQVTEKEAGCEIQGNGAVLSCYIRENIGAQKEKKRTAVIICPGGGYQWCSDREAEPVAMEFLNMGCQAFVLNYSVAPNRMPVSLMELARAVELVRSRGAEWHIDENDILVCGFSAGGHLAASLGVYWKEEWLAERLGVSGEAIRPNGLILTYPVITGGEYAHEGSVKSLMGEAYINGPEGEKYREIFSLEKHVGPHVPPVFLWHSFMDQSVPAENSLLFAWALRKSGVNTEFHMFQKGAHGVSLANEETQVPGADEMIEPCCQQWIPLVRTWLRCRER